MPRIAVAFLVDPHGHVLLQHRDEHAPQAANQWGMVGGHVEPGEDFDTAIHREILEETGIVTGPEDLVLWQATEFRYSDGQHSTYRVYAGRVDLTDDDIVLGEGRAIVFVAPAETQGLDKAESTAHFLPAFLASDLYRQLRDERTSMSPTEHEPHQAAGQDQSSPNKPSPDRPSPARPSPDRPRLRRVEVPAMGAEDVVIDDDGNAWTGTEEGSIWRVGADGSVARVGNTGGRPLGVELLGDDRLLVADAEKGLLAMSRTTGVVERLATEVDGQPIKVCNNAAVAANGDIWFSDSSTVYPLSQWKSDFVEHTCTGRLLCRRADGSIEVHLDGLAFANGVALAADESFVCVAESGGRTVVRLWLTGDRAGTRDLLVGDLPGYPDNISRGTDGLIWVAIASPRDSFVEVIRFRFPRPLRKLVTRIPDALQPMPKKTARVQAYDDTGRLVHDLDADASEYHFVTGVREHHGQVWLSSLQEPALAVLSLSAEAH
jgi:sugar lactone lactonase YvrE/8-oxo-dGTP pyrophosphatase MutT (NUDIX family)